ncbi:MAG: SirB2 family protein [Halioglobus sp.]
MTLAELLKFIHVTCATLSIAGFGLRGYWMVTDNRLLQRRAAKVLPHVIDTLLLGSAISLLIVWQLSPLSLPWLGAKIIALLVYITLGMVALRFGRSKSTRVIAWVMALLTALYIVSVAYSKNPLGFLQLLRL